MKPDANPTVKSADRALDILEYVADAPEAPSFSMLMAALGIPRSSLFHLLNNLQARGYLEQGAGNARYRLGQRIRDLAARVSAPPLAALVQPHLDRLTGAVNETSGFYVRVGDSMETLASAAGNQALAYTMKVGERAPLYAISGGKVALATFGDDELEAYLQRVKLEGITANTIRSRDRLRDEVVLARRDGFASSHEEFTLGITGIAVPVTRHGQFVGTLNLAIPTARFGPGQDGAFRRHLQAAAAGLSRALEASEAS
jgi:IclR family transcriptional regulator, acetate operon repressor